MQRMSQKGMSNAFNKKENIVYIGANYISCPLSRGPNLLQFTHFYKDHFGQRFLAGPLKIEGPG